MLFSYSFFLVIVCAKYNELVACCRISFVNEKLLSSVVSAGFRALFCSYAIDVSSTVVNASAKSPKCGTKEVRRKGAEPEVTNVPKPAAAADKVLPEAVRVGAGIARGGGKGAKNKDEESVTYATKTFPGRDSMQSQSSGQLSICHRITVHSHCACCCYY